MAKSYARARGKVSTATPTVRATRPKSPLQRLADDSPAVARMTALQRLADPLQRMEEEEMLQGKADPLQRMDQEDLQMKADPLQRMEEEEPMQGKADPLQRMDEEDMQMKADTLQRNEAAVPARDGLPGDLHAGIEAVSGHALDDVRVHRNSAAPAAVQAHAFAQGSDIHLAPGQDQHLPHEAWHVVQQREGRVQPTTEVNGAAVNDDTALETEADRMGARAAAAAREAARDR